MGIAFLPAFVLIVGVLGSIVVGVASPTEAASVGAAGGLVLTILKGRFSMEMLRNVMQVTTRITSLGFIILVGANCFGLVFRGLNGDHLVQDFLKSLPFGAYGVLAFVMFVIFLLGFFIDYYEICFIHVPLTPPFCFSLLFLRGVAPPEVRTLDIYRGVVPFVALQLIGLVLTIALPILVFGPLRFFWS